MTAIVGLAANVSTGILLDTSYFSRKARSRITYIFTAALVTASWAWNTQVQVKLTNMTHAAGAPPVLDIGDGHLFNSAFAVYIFFRFFYEVLQTYVYWLMAEIKGAQRDGDIARTTGILRSWESIGSTIAYAVGTTTWGNLNQLILGFVLWGVTIPPTLWAIYGDFKKPTAEDRGYTTDESSNVEAQQVVLSPEEKR